MLKALIWKLIKMCVSSACNRVKMPIKIPFGAEECLCIYSEEKKAFS